MSRFLKLGLWWVASAASLPVVASCGDAGTGAAGATLTGSYALWQIDGTSLPIVQIRTVNADPTPSCTQYLTAMRIDVTSPAAATRSQTERFTCTNGIDRTGTIIESGTVSTVADTVRFDFQETGLYLTTHYYGLLDGNTLTIVRRMTEPTGYLSGQVNLPPTTDPSQLVFRRL